MILVLGDVIVFIIKLHYSSAIAVSVCVSHFSHLIALPVSDGIFAQASRRTTQGSSLAVFWKHRGEKTPSNSSRAERRRWAWNYLSLFVASMLNFHTNRFKCQDERWLLLCAKLAGRVARVVSALAASTARLREKEPPWAATWPGSAAMLSSTHHDPH